MDRTPGQATSDEIDIHEKHKHKMPRSSKTNIDVSFVSMMIADIVVIQPWRVARPKVMIIRIAVLWNVPIDKPQRVKLIHIKIDGHDERSSCTYLNSYHRFLHLRRSIVRYAWYSIELFRAMLLLTAVRIPYVARLRRLVLHEFSKQDRLSRKYGFYLSVVHVCLRLWGSLDAQPLPAAHFETPSRSNCSANFEFWIARTGWDRRLLRASHCGHCTMSHERTCLEHGGCCRIFSFNVLP